jgi:hypothetical protein
MLFVWVGNPMRIRLSWPFDTATTLSIIAIAVSVLQFLLTTPVLTQFYMTPELIVTGGGSSPDGQTLTGFFQLTNEGRALANNVQIAFTLQEHQRISVMPNVNATIVPDEKPAVIKNVRVEIPKVLSKEQIMIWVWPGPNGERLHPELAKAFMEGGVREIPMVSFVKSDEGFGKNLTAGVDRQFLEKSDLTSHSSGSGKAGP